MPELPEVEVTRLGLLDALQGAQIQAIEMGKPLRWPLGCESSALVGQTVVQLSRRSKYLLLHLSAGYLLIHLGMSGRLRWFDADAGAPQVHDHFQMKTQRGVLRLHDPRRFGAVVFVPDLQSVMAQKLLGHLGVEPLAPDFDVVSCAQRLQMRSSAIKQVLLAGQVVVGAGNIYACEALFLARIHPQSAAAKVPLPQLERLAHALVQVLSAAIGRGGSSLKDFANSNGQTGYFQLDVHVYDRASQPCKVCANPIARIRQGQRSSFLCPQCQHLYC
jgi:formamidopyrimidine-DNA glycosylase